MKLNITRAMSGKLEGLWAINTSPLDNPFCVGMAKQEGNICKFCYSQKLLRGYRKGCRPSMARNLEVLSKPLASIPRIRDPKLFRFNAHGELVNRQNAVNYYLIAEANPHVTFALWTKRPELLEGLVKPANLFLVYSSPKINVRSEKPEGFDKVFAVYSDRDSVPKGVTINCYGKHCQDCKLCYSKGTTFINELIRRMGG